MTVNLPQHGGREQQGQPDGAGRADSQATRAPSFLTALSAAAEEREAQRLRHRRRLMLRLRILGALTLLVLGGAGAALWWRFGRTPDYVAIAGRAALTGDGPAAVNAWRAAVLHDPDNPDIHQRLGILELQNGDPFAAEKDLKQAQQLGADPRPMMVVLAQAYLGESKYQQVLDEFQVADAPPEMASAIKVVRGIAEQGLGHLDAAQVLLDEAEREAPRSIDTAVAAARNAMLRKDYTHAANDVTHALQIDPGRVEALQVAAQLYVLTGDRASAERALDAFVAKNPRNLEVRLDRADNLLALGQDDKAVADVDLVLKERPNAARALYLKAVLLTRSGEYAAADVELTKINYLFNSFPRAWYFRALTKYNLGQDEQATDAATHYVTRTPNDPEGVKLLARIDLAENRPEQAQAALRAATQAGHTDADFADLLKQAGEQAAKAGRAAVPAGSQAQAAAAQASADMAGRLAASRLGTGDIRLAAQAVATLLKAAPGKPEDPAARVIAALGAGDADAAQAALDAARAADGDTEAVGILIGLLQLARIDTAAALATFQSLAQAFPHAAQVKLNLAKVQSLRGDTAAAEATLLDALKDDPADPDVLATLVQALMAERRVADAVAVTEAARKAAPSQPLLLAMLSDLYVAANAPGKAVDLLDTATADQDASANVQAARARALMAVSRRTDAAAALRRVIEIDPSAFGARRELVNLLLFDGDVAGARNVMADGLRRLPGDPALLHAAVGIELRVSGLQAALAMADRLRANRANLPNVRTLRGDLFMEARRPDAALADYAEQYRNDPSGLLATRIAATWVALGKPDRAEAALRDWLAHAPKDADVLAMLASLHMQAGQFDAAEQGLRAALAARPADPVILNNLAWIDRLHNDPRARPLAEQAYLLNPNADSADTLGWVLAGAGELDKAIALLSQATTLNKDDPTMRYHLASTLARAGQKDAAVKLLVAVLDSAPPFTERADARGLLDDLSRT